MRMLRRLQKERKGDEKFFVLRGKEKGRERGGEKGKREKKRRESKRGAREKKEKEREKKKTKLIPQVLLSGNCFSV